LEESAGGDMIVDSADRMQEEVMARGQVGRWAKGRLAYREEMRL
jgi:hypothetical protein